MELLKQSKGLVKLEQLSPIALTVWNMVKMRKSTDGRIMMAGMNQLIDDRVNKGINLFGQRSVEGELLLLFECGE